MRAAVLARGRVARPRRAYHDADSDASEPEVNRRRKHHNPWHAPIEVVLTFDKTVKAQWGPSQEFALMLSCWWEA